MDNRLHELRESLCLSKKEFADKLTVSANTITNIESCKNQLGITVALLVAKTFNVSLDWLYGLSNEKNIAGMERFESFFNFKKISVLYEDKNIALSKDYTTIELSDIVIKYYDKISEIEKEYKENNLPEEAYKIWKESVKKDYESKLNNDSSSTEYVLIENSEDFVKDLLYAKTRQQIPDLETKKALDEINL